MYFTDKRIAEQQHLLGEERNGVCFSLKKNTSSYLKYFKVLAGPIKMSEITLHILCICFIYIYICMFVFYVFLHLYLHILNICEYIYCASLIAKYQTVSKFGCLPFLFNAHFFLPKVMDGLFNASTRSFSNGLTEDICLKKSMSWDGILDTTATNKSTKMFFVTLLNNNILLKLHSTILKVTLMKCRAWVLKSEGCFRESDTAKHKE